MQSSPTRSDNWAKGANNIAKPERLPEGFVRDLVNLDPTEGGQLELRADSRRVLEAAAMRLAVALPGLVVYVDGSAIGCYSGETDSAEVIGSVIGAGDLSGVAFDGQVYLSGIEDSLRVDGVSVKPWAVPEPTFTLEVVAGDLPAGIYKVAVTAFGDDGEESGVEPLIVRIAASQAIRVTSGDHRVLRAYVSQANGSTLYSQGPLIGGAMAITRVDDHRERLETTGLVPLPACSMLAAHHSVIVGIADHYVVFTSPMFPHLMDPIAGFFRYPEPPSLIASTEGGVYVVADKTYFITGLDTDTPSQVAVLDIGGVKGSAVSLPDGSAAWFTRYGQAIGNSAGEVSLPNRKSYAPDLASHGSAGVVENNGNSMVVTTMRGVAKPNNLATGDFADLEVGDES